MKIEDVRIGMKVKANQSSDAKYTVTNRRYGCEGIVRGIHNTTISIEVTKHELEPEVGLMYKHLLPEYFDDNNEAEKTERGKMKITLKEEEINVGDFVIVEGGALLYIIDSKDSYMAVDMESSEVVCTWGDLEGLVSAIEEVVGNNILRVVHSENIEIIER